MENTIYRRNERVGNLGIKLSSELTAPIIDFEYRARLAYNTYSFINSIYSIMEYAKEERMQYAESTYSEAKEKLLNDLDNSHIYEDFSEVRELVHKLNVFTDEEEHIKNVLTVLSDFTKKLIYF